MALQIDKKGGKVSDIKEEDGGKKTNSKQFTKEKECILPSIRPLSSVKQDSQTFSILANLKNNNTNSKFNNHGINSGINEFINPGEYGM